MEVWVCLVFLLIQTTLIAAFPQPGVANDEEVYSNVGPFRRLQENESQPISDPFYKKVGGDIRTPKFLPGNAGVRNVWPNGIIPFTIECSIQNNDKAIKAIKEAMVAWETKTGGCVQFIPKRAKDQIYVKLGRADGCWSGGVGYEGRPYSVSVGFTCEYKHVMEHELGHVIGFYHEQSRTDRDRYIDILMENVEPAQKENFDIASDSVNSGEAYDFDSIMHYPFWAFSMYYGKDTIKPKYPYDQQRHRPYRTISESDIRQTQKLYGCQVRAKRSSGAFEDCNTGKTHKQCERWAAAGHCKLNPDALLVTCPVSCNNCAPCKDNVGYCKQRYKDCRNYNIEPQKFYDFLIDCRLTCKMCKPSQEPTEAPTKKEQTTKETTTEKPTTEKPTTEKPTTEAPSPLTTSERPQPMQPLTMSSIHPFPPIEKQKYKGVKCEDKSENCAYLKTRNICDDAARNEKCLLTCKDHFEENLCDMEEPKPDGWCNTPFGISAFNRERIAAGITLDSSSNHAIPGDTWKYLPRQARLYNEDNSETHMVGTWCASTHASSGTEYLEINFAEKRNVAAIATQGRPKFFEHVKTYKVRFYNKDNRDWSWYEEDGEPKTFIGNCDHRTPVINKFKEPHYVDAIRIYPLEYVGGRCLRVELYGC